VADSVGTPYTVADCETLCQGCHDLAHASMNGAAAKARRAKPVTKEEILALRGQMQMSQQEFAVRLGLKTRGAVCQLERGTRKPSGPLLALLNLLIASQESRQTFAEVKRSDQQPA